MLFFGFFQFLDVALELIASAVNLFKLPGVRDLGQDVGKLLPDVHSPFVRLVGLARFELATYGLGNRRSIHLSYSPAALHFITQSLSLRSSQDR